MNSIRHNLAVVFCMLLSVGGFIGLVIFIATFDKSQASYIGLVASGASFIAGLATIRAINKSWGDAFADILDMFFFGFTNR